MNKLLTLLLVGACILSANTFKINSPNNFLEIIVNVDNIINYEVKTKNETLLEPSQIALKTGNNHFGINAKILDHKIITIDKIIHPVVKEQSAKIQDHYNQLTLEFEKFNLEFRAYNDGVAYRFITNVDGEQTIVNETIEYNFPDDHPIWFPEEESMYTHQERLYEYTTLKEITDKRICSIPTLIEQEDNRKIFISETDLFDYPGFFLTGTGNGLKAVFPHYPKKIKQTSDRDVQVLETENYLAKTSGSRTFPWRLMIIGNDTEVAESQLVYLLARECQLEDTDWIKPGKVAWDWWNALNITGVDFRSGVNTETYKYYMDFAAKYNIDYIILDEGWYKLDDIMQLNPDIDMDELTRYSKKTNVGLILWTTWKALDDKLVEALDQFEKWDIKGIKVDFMQRDDQWMVNYYEKVAKEAAKRHMLVNFHGSYKPAGLRRAYPNVITREGVLGLEQSKWGEKANPEMAVILPFIRNVAGPMDYTPGAMRNAVQSNFQPMFSKPMSQGTRCHQLAMYIIYESPLQMLADNPSHYYDEPVCMEFLEAVPTVWDNTEILKGKIGDYIITARQSGEDYYLGAMTDRESRDFEIDLDFLGQGKYRAIIYRDGINADRNAEDFTQIKKVVSSKDKIKISMAPGGGFAARFLPVK